VGLAALLLTGCSAGDGSDAAAPEPAVENGAVGAEGVPEEDVRSSDQDAEAASDAGTAAVSADVSAVENRSVIYTVDLVVEVDDVPGAAEDAAAIATRFGGYVQSESSFGSVPDPLPDPAPEPLPVEPVPLAPSASGQAVLVLRVPAERHLDAVQALEDLGETVTRTRNAQDVTDEVVDVETRIATQQASIDRLQVLLAEASEISDILAIETELTQRIADLESLKARQQQLAGATELATISVTFAPPQTVVEEGTGFLAGLRAGWRAFVRAAELAVTALGAALPFVGLLLVLAAPLVVWLVVRHRRRRASVRAPSSVGKVSGEPASGQTPPDETLVGSEPGSGA
jgi:hypothetical protein